MTKAEALSEIAKEIMQCKKCQEDTLGKPVPGEGNPDATIVFVGEAPGKQEAATGRPFIGRSGALLRKTIKSIDLNPQQIFITSVGKYLPKRGTPTAQQIAQGRQHLLKQLALIDPKVIVLLGRVAVQSVLGEKNLIKTLHGTTRVIDGTIYFLTIHPAAALRFQPLKAIFLADFQALQRLLRKEQLL